MDKKRLKRPCILSLPLMLATLTATQGWASTNMGGQNSDKSALPSMWSARSTDMYAAASVATDTESENTESTESENATAQKFNMEIKSDVATTTSISTNSNLQLTSEYATIEGGSVTLINNQSKEWTPFSKGSSITVSDKSKQYIKVTLSTALANNDVITLGGLEKAYITTTSTYSKDDNISITKGAYSITDSDGLAGKTDFYLWLNSKDDALTSITVTQRTALTATYSETSITDKKVGDENIDFPTLTVKAGETTLTSSDYTVTYSFSPENIVEVEDGQMSFVGAGTTTVTATVTPTNATLYLPCTATFTVTVDEDKQAYIVTTDTPHTKHSVLKTSDGNLQVTLGGWMFKGTKKMTNGTTGDTMGNGDWGSTTGKSGVKGYSHYIAEGTNNNPRQEDGSNAQPQSTAVYNAKINTDGVTAETLRDQMFNVPVEGAFFSFAPKTNGTVTAVIFQSGVFDTSDGKYYYRPQRRTFIVDEAGNFVPSTGKVAVTDGIFNPGNSYEISNYTWDLNDDKAPSVDDVKKHFVGLSEFTFANTQKNGVYESNLDYSTVKNELIKNGTDNLPNGARGWCVLSDGSVIYTFDVKAGKTYYLYNFGSRIGLYGFKMEATENVTEDNVTLKQDGTSTLTKTESGHVAKVSLDRTFKGGVWNAAVLPFSLNKQQVDAIFGQSYGYGNYETDNTQILYFDHIEGTTAYFMRHANNTIVAGKPFLIKPKNTGDITLNTADIEDYPYVTIEATDEPADWCKGNGYVWKSSYKPFSVKNGEYFIGGSDGKFYRWTGNNSVEAKGYRGYLAFTDDNTSDAKPALHVAMKSAEDSDGSTTLIEGLTIDSNGHLSQQPANGKVYTIGGQLVASDASALSTLPHGVYIVNGKKYVK